MPLEIEMSSPPDRDQWVGEIWNDNVLLCEVRRDDNQEIIVEFYAGDNAVTVNLSDFLFSIDSLKDKMGISIP